MESVNGDAKNMQNPDGTSPGLPSNISLSKDGLITPIELELDVIAENPEWKNIILNIVSKENLDPWNVDIKTLTGRYLEKIRDLEKLNLRVSANVILAASILVRYKADSWTAFNGKKETFPWIPDSIIPEPFFPSLEPSFRSTTRRVTLDELIAAVEDIMHKEKTKAQRQAQKPQAPPEALLKIINNDLEPFETSLLRVFEQIKTSVDAENLTTFSTLAKQQPSSVVLSNFLALLHLANARKISVWQERVFSEVFILLEDATTTGLDEIIKQEKEEQQENAVQTTIEQ